MKVLIDFAEKGFLPDTVIRFGIRYLCRQRKKSLYIGSNQTQLSAQLELRNYLSQQPIAIAVADANQQHYELPYDFFTHILGPQLKYSCCYWPEENTTLAMAENHSLQQIAERAELADGQTILELGCGWGSLSLWMARHYPNSKIVAVTNSLVQQQYVLAQCQASNITNLEIQKIDINDFSSQNKFDRIVSVEMFEHVRNHSLLLAKLRQLMKTDGKLFIHIFCHRDYTYLFEEKDATDWMTSYFFRGGMMPAFSLPLYWQKNFEIEKNWAINGKNYEKTANAWLNNLDNQRDKLLAILAEHYGKQQAIIWLQRWRIFFMSCAELFAYQAGSEWFVGHYLFQCKQ